MLVNLSSFLSNAGRSYLSLIPLRCYLLTDLARYELNLIRPAN